MTAGDRAMYSGVAAQLYWTLIVGDKPLFACPCWYLPAGGGIDGMGGLTNGIACNGEPTPQSILKLARPIAVPVRQNFAVEANFYTIGATNIVNGFTATDGQKVVAFYIDGMVTRDVL